jgi:FkbH-like protein
MPGQDTVDPLACSTPAEFERLARRLREHGAAPATKLSVLASFSAHFMSSYLVVASHRSGVPVEPWFGPFNQFEQVVLDPRSELWLNAPDVVWLAPRLEDLQPDLLAQFCQIGAEAARERLASVVRRLSELASAVRNRSQATLFVSNLCLPQLNTFYVLGASEPSGLKYLIHEANLQLAHYVAGLPDAWILDYEGAVSDCGAARWTDPKLHYWARTGIGPLGFESLASRFCRCLAAIRRPAAKCVVVDLDNTLWGGVIGDDGIEGVKIGHDFPGNVFRDIQTFIKGLRARGILLAIASKNDERTALRALETHPEMILRPADFAATLINWDPKPMNLQRIATLLNIGLDSLVFIDDNPVERAHVRTQLPMVEVPEMPTDVVEWPSALGRIERFDRPRLTAEDLQRADMYAADLGRKQLQRSAESLESFLTSLDMTATVGLCDDRTLDRIHQLIEKTNQFNLTSRRYKKDEVRRMGEDPGRAVAWLRLRDRYGDMGLVGVGIIGDAGNGVWDIDTFLMSCRVMDRQVERALLAYLAEVARERGGKILRGIYIPTAKNEPVRGFFGAHAFALDPASKTGGEHVPTYTREIDDDMVAWPPVIHRQQELA